MASVLLALTLGDLALPYPGLGQQAQQPPQAPNAPSERVRVPTSNANVHMGPSTGSEVLLLAPRGTVLAVVGRDKEWVQVRLAPELRKTGMLMRWYKSEDRGWMHDSTVEIVKAGAK